MTIELDCAGRRLRLGEPQVMGILNVTPDSFSDGGRFVVRDQALRQAQRMLAEGAAIIDVGGESTRPGAPSVSTQEELDRVIPIIESLAAEVDLPISIDTSKPVVMREAVRAGAGLINDVLALREADAVGTVAELGVPVCLMHMQGRPRTMQEAPRYTDVVAEVHAFLAERIATCVEAGINRDGILIDPGFGFGKTVQHNLNLLRQLDAFGGLGVPLLVGLSRKSTIGHVLGREEPDQRLHGSVAAAVMAAWQGAAIIRAHDVGPTVDAMRMVAAVRRAT